MKKKKAYMECLRVFSILGVIYCHTAARGLTLYEVTDVPFEYWFSKIALLFSQVCVPIFFMISGALLLPRQEDLYKHLKHRVLRFSVITVLAIFLQYLYELAGHPIYATWHPEEPVLRSSFSFTDFCKMLHSTGAIYQHWFLFAYLSFLLLLPFLRYVAKALDEKDLLWYLLALYLLVTIVYPFWERWQHLPPSGLQFPLFANCAFFPLVGYVCDRKEVFRKGRTVLCLIAASLVVTVINLVMMEAKKDLFEGFYVFLYTVTIFVAVKYCFQRWACPKKLESFWIFCGSGVFGTYLLETVLRHLCEPVYGLFLNLGRIPALFAWVFCSAALGVFVVGATKMIFRARSNKKS